jgi:hypothetical protein
MQCIGSNSNQLNLSYCNSDTSWLAHVLLPSQLPRGDDKDCCGRHTM